jgi:hypothetical protein
MLTDLAVSHDVEEDRNHAELNGIPPSISTAREESLQNHNGLKTCRPFYYLDGLHYKVNTSTLDGAIQAIAFVSQLIQDVQGGALNFFVGGMSMHCLQDCFYVVSKKVTS